MIRILIDSYFLQSRKSERPLGMIIMTFTFDISTNPFVLNLFKLFLPMVLLFPFFFAAPSPPAPLLLQLMSFLPLLISDRYLSSMSWCVFSQLQSVVAAVANMKEISFARGYPKRSRVHTRHTLLATLRLIYLIFSLLPSISFLIY